MKKLILMFMSVLIVGTAAAQKAEKEVKKAVQSFVSAGDAQDADALSAILHPTFRVILNQQMGSTETSTMDRAVYIQMIKEKKFGGDKRSVSFVHVDVSGNNATATAEFKGEKANFYSTLTLVKTSKGKWQIVQDLPNISAVGK